MPSTPQWKKDKAFRMRLQRISLARVSRECHISTRTLQKLEQGWVDKNGTFHRGWREDLERAWSLEGLDDAQAGLVLKQERLTMYERLARQAVELIEKQFPNIKMKNATDVKALLSEVRELCRLMSIERGEYHPRGRSVVNVKTDITLVELQERYAAAKKVEIQEVTAPEEVSQDDVARALEGPPEEE